MDWMKEYLENMDRKTKKLMTIIKPLHPRSCVARLFMPRGVGGKGMQSVEEIINIKRRILGQNLKHNEDDWLTQHGIKKSS